MKIKQLALTLIFMMTAYGAQSEIIKPNSQHSASKTSIENKNSFKLVSNPTSKIVDTPNDDDLFSIISIVDSFKETYQNSHISVRVEYGNYGEDALSNMTDDYRIRFNDSASNKILTIQVSTETTSDVSHTQWLNNILNNCVTLASNYNFKDDDTEYFRIDIEKPPAAEEDACKIYKGIKLKNNVQIEYYTVTGTESCRISCSL